MTLRKTSHCGYGAPTDSALSLEGLGASCTSSTDAEPSTPVTLCKHRRNRATSRGRTSPSQQPQPHNVHSSADSLSGEDHVYLKFSDAGNGAKDIKSAPKLLVGLAASEVEPWQRFPHLQHGYRRGGTYWSCICSLLQLHNETLNAWTMVISTIVGHLLFFSTVSHLSCSWLDFSPFLAVWLGQTLHGPLSCAYHTFMCMSAETANLWRRLDLTFILVLNALATYGLSYFTFGFWTSLVWTAVITSVAAVGIRNVQRLQPKQPLDRKRVLGMIGITCMGYYIPLAIRGVGVFLTTARPWPELGIALTVLGCHSVGAITYATHWPQRQFPGVFDLGGFSHNLMHIFCFAAYNCAYPYISHLYLKQQEWRVLA